ncbi:MAG: hypothetical protein K0Q57_189 [Gammaproteobacteria bacterium]|jgi:hypothetical protein|nr:hypothetical protein [Gammaproteobacteria bacterium]
MLLAEFQQEFFEALFDPKELGPQQSGLSIYQNSMRSVLFHTLSKTFPACKRLVGDEYFAKFAWSYIEKNPSVSPNLNDYGENFAQFIQTSETELLYFAELARLEWNWHKTFYGPNNESVDEKTLISGLPKGCRLLKFDYAVDKIWQVCQPEYKGSFEFELLQPCYLIMFQVQQHIKMIALDEQEWLFLQNMSQNLANN